MKGQNLARLFLSLLEYKKWGLKMFLLKSMVERCVEKSRNTDNVRVEVVRFFEAVNLCHVWLVLNGRMSYELAKEHEVFMNVIAKKIFFAGVERERIFRDRFDDYFVKYVNTVDLVLDDLSDVKEEILYDAGKEDASYVRGCVGYEIE